MYFQTVSNRAAVFYKVAYAVIFETIISSRFSHAVGRVETIFKIVRASVNEPLEYCRAVFLALEYLFEVSVSVILRKALVESDNPYAVRLEHCIVTDSGEIVGVDPYTILRDEVEASFKQSSSSEGVAPGHCFEGTCVYLLLSFYFRYVYKSSVHKLAERRLRGVKVNAFAVLCLTYEHRVRAAHILRAERGLNGAE